MSDFKLEFGTQIRRLRARIDITQIELAERLGVSENMVKGYESGKYGPEFDKLPKFAEALEVSVSGLFDFDAGD
jgi:transcriptional regulator with XRE-family HTH domain